MLDAHNFSARSDGSTLTDGDRADLLAVVSGILAASGRLESSYVPAMLKAGGRWLEYLRDGGAGFDWDVLELAGDVLFWRDPARCHRLVTAQVRAHPTVALKFFGTGGGQVMLKPIGRTPKGWKTLTLRSVRGGPRPVEQTSPWQLAARLRKATSEPPRPPHQAVVRPSIPRAA